MCSLRFTKSLLPFAITFMIGLLVASVFYGLTTRTKSKSFSRATPKKVKKMKTHCNAYRSNGYKRVVEKSKVNEDVFVIKESSNSDSDIEFHFDK